MTAPSAQPSPDAIRISRSLDRIVEQLQLIYFTLEEIKNKMDE